MPLISQIKVVVLTIIVERKKSTTNDNDKDNDEILVSIKDTGSGIDPEILPKLFTKFATKSPIAGGTGLGLFISKSIIEMHGGKIWAINNKEKKRKRCRLNIYIQLTSKTITTRSLGIFKVTLKSYVK